MAIVTVDQITQFCGRETTTFTFVVAGTLVVFTQAVESDFHLVEVGQTALAPGTPLYHTLASIKHLAATPRRLRQGFKLEVPDNVLDALADVDA